MSMKRCKPNRIVLGGPINEAVKRLIMLIAIVAAGILIMYFSDDAATAICVGIGYLIAITGAILVLIGCDYDRILKVLFFV